jgi:glycosyltransferase involved in cell wall biosynthesis
MLEGAHGALRKEFRKLLDWLAGEPRPDVITLPNSLLISLAAPLREATHAPVCCTLQGEELFLDGLQRPYRERALDLIRQQVPHVDRFIAVSNYCAAFMSDLLRLPAGRVDVVPLGINMTGYERREPEARPDGFRVGYFARVAPEKGLAVLADAYAKFRGRIGHSRARLAAAGYLSAAHEPYLRDVRRRLEAAGCVDDFVYAGALDRDGKIAFLRDLDVLSVPATYDEPKGMFLLEAMASGVPVVQPKRGAFTEIVERTGGGILVRPDDPDSLADGLFELWGDAPRRAQLASAAYEGVRAHYSVQRSADRLLAVFAQC